MSWRVQLTKKADKQQRHLPENIRLQLRALVLDLEKAGPVAGNWPNYSKLSDGSHHCHLKYRYVVCWDVIDNQIRLIEVYYVGSREKAPY